ncbi:MAG: hypothetical protein ABIS86_21620 [Streptosporangiaceae bacterium]
MPRTPREVGKQVHEAVNEQVKDLPIQAARLAMFGVGRALVLADRATRDYKDLRSGELRPVLDRLRDDADKLTGGLTTRVGARVDDLISETPVGKVLDLVGAGQPAPEPVIPVASPPLRASQIAAQAAAAKKKSEITLGKPAEAPVAEVTTPVAPVAPVATKSEITIGKPAAAPVVDQVAEEIAEPVTPAVLDAVEATLSASTLPVPNYDGLTHASLRARLRKLTAPEVEQLREYETAHADRAEILKMYDNRIAKLSEGS